MNIDQPFSLDALSHRGPAEAANRPEKTPNLPLTPAPLQRPLKVPFYQLKNKYLCPVMKRVVRVFKFFSQHSMFCLSLRFIYLNVLLKSKSVLSHTEENCSCTYLKNKISVLLCLQSAGMDCSYKNDLL